MSTQDDQMPEIADIRHTEKKLPAHLGENPSEESLNDWFFDHGWVWLCQIKNNSGNIVRYDNPYRTENNDIAPGVTDDFYCSGYFPYWKSSKRYHIAYYNKAFKAWKTISIKDLEGHWWISFEQADVDEDIRALCPASPAKTAGINLTITETGYEIYNVGQEKFCGSISFEP